MELGQLQQLRHAGRQAVKVAEEQLASGMMTLLQLLVVVNRGAQPPFLHIQTHTLTLDSFGVFIHSFIQVVVVATYVGDEKSKTNEVI